MKVEIMTESWHQRNTKTVGSILFIILLMCTGNIVGTFLIGAWVLFGINLFFGLVFFLIDKSFSKYVAECKEMEKKE